MSNNPGGLETPIPGGPNPVSKRKALEARHLGGMESRRRSIVKALSWRLIALVVTVSLVWIVAGEVHFAVAIGVLDGLAKLAAYYLHERAWNRLHFGWSAQ